MRYVLRMGQPMTENCTPFAFEGLFLIDEEARPLLVPIVKATYTFDAAGRLCLAPEQVPLNMTGEWWGKPGESSYKYEPECAFIKLATDVVLIGSAHAPKKGTCEVLVTLGVGALRKSVRVVGDRVWFKSLGEPGLTELAVVHLVGTLLQIGDGALETLALTLVPRPGRGPSTRSTLAGWPAESVSPHPPAPGR